MLALYSRLQIPVMEDSQYLCFALLTCHLHFGVLVCTSLNQQSKQAWTACVNSQGDRRLHNTFRWPRAARMNITRLGIYIGLQIQKLLNDWYNVAFRDAA